MTTLRTMIVLATAHLDEDTSDMLEEMGEDTDQARYIGDWRDRIVRCGHGYGHWIKVPRPFDDDPDDTIEERVRGMPACLRDCILHAASLGAAWILFDRDEPETDALDTYQWGS